MTPSKGRCSRSASCGTVVETTRAATSVETLADLLSESVGVQVRRRRHWARMGAILLSCVDLLLLPYGTALGVYALWILLRDETRPLFEG